MWDAKVLILSQKKMSYFCVPKSFTNNTVDFLLKKNNVTDLCLNFHFTRNDFRIS